MRTRDQGGTDGPEMRAVEQELSEWRRHHGAPTPLPQSVWEGAARLGRTYGVATVARRLRLNPTQLRRRAEMYDLAVDAQSAPTFVEVVAPPPRPSAVECVIEVEAAHGGRLRVTLKGASMDAVADIVREFGGGR